MTRPLFPTFLEDPAVYTACQEYWEQLIRDVVAAAGRSDFWEPYIGPTYADGTTLRDGNPMWNGLSPDGKRSFKIIQWPVADLSQPELSLWFNHDDLGIPNEPEDDLTLSLSLTEETASMVRLLLSKWVDQSTTLRDMAQFIKDTLGESPHYELPKGS